MRDKYYLERLKDKWVTIKNYPEKYKYRLEDDQGAWVIKKVINKYYEFDSETEEEKEARLAKEKIEFRESRLSQILDK